MDKIKQWTLTVSAVSVVSGILLSILPGNKLKSAYKTLVSILLVYAFMLPVISSFSIDFNIKDYLKDNYKVSEHLDKYALKNALSSAEKAVEKTLHEHFNAKGIECNFSVSCSISDGEIVLSSISVSSNEEADTIISMLDEIGFDKNIIKIKGEQDE